jgi:hypothetical protein
VVEHARWRWNRLLYQYRRMIRVLGKEKGKDDETTCPGRGDLERKVDNSDIEIGQTHLPRDKDPEGWAQRGPGPARPRKQPEARETRELAAGAPGRSQRESGAVEWVGFAGKPAGNPPRWAPRLAPLTAVPDGSDNQHKMISNIQEPRPRPEFLSGLLHRFTCSIRQAFLPCNISLAFSQRMLMFFLLCMRQTSSPLDPFS